MRQLIYPCRGPEVRKLGNGVKIDYDGSVLIVSCGYYLSAITAHRGETIIITVEERMVACRAKESAAPERQFRRRQNETV